MNPTASKACSGCKNAIGNKLFLDCSECKHKYDLVCVNVTEQYFRRMEKDRLKESWKCPECQSKVPKTDNQNSPLRPAPVPVPTSANSAVETVGKNSAKTNAKNSASSSNQSENVTQRKKIAQNCRLDYTEDTQNLTENIKQQVQECLKSTMETYVMTMLDRFNDSFFSRIDKLTAAMETISMRLAGFDERISLLEARLGQGTEPVQNHLTADIERLKCELNERDQELLCNDLEITGIPETNNENMLHLVTLLSRKIGVAVSEQDVVSVMRVGPRRAVLSMAAATSDIGTNKENDSSVCRDTASDVTSVGEVTSDMASAATTAPHIQEGAGAPSLFAGRPLVVRLVRRAQRDELLRAARIRRVIDTVGFGLPGEPKRIYVNERLTPTNRRLFYRTRMEAKHQQWRAPWTSRGSIFVRRDADHSPQRIRSDADLSRVFGK